MKYILEYADQGNKSYVDLIKDINDISYILYDTGIIDKIVFNSHDISTLAPSHYSDKFNLITMFLRIYPKYSLLDTPQSEIEEFYDRCQDICSKYDSTMSKSRNPLVFNIQINKGLWVGNLNY